MFAVDCEMCLTDRNILELTHVAVVDEKLRCVFNSHVKPEAKITNYLTQYSGVTARDMANPGVLTVKEVQTYVFLMRLLLFFNSNTVVTQNLNCLN